MIKKSWTDSTTNTLHFQSYYQIWVDAMELNLLMIVVLLQIFVEKVKEIVTMTLTVLEPWNVAAAIVLVLFLLILNVAMTLINKIELGNFAFRNLQEKLVKSLFGSSICHSTFAY